MICFIVIIYLVFKELLVFLNNVKMGICMELFVVLSFFIVCIFVVVYNLEKIGK